MSTWIDGASLFDPVGRVRMAGGRVRVARGRQRGGRGKMAGSAKRVLIAGESWIMHTIHQKGFDDFRTTAYGEGHQWLSAALTAGGYDVEHLPNHLANEK